MSINAVHVTIFSRDAEATRAFLRDLDVPGLGELGLYEPRHPTRRADP